MWGQKVIPRQWGEKPGSNKASRLIRRRPTRGGSPRAGDLDCNPALLSLASWICLNTFLDSPGAARSYLHIPANVHVPKSDSFWNLCDWGVGVGEKFVPCAVVPRGQQGWQLWFWSCGHHNNSGLFAVTAEAGWEMLLVTGLVYISDIYKKHPMQNGSVALTFV